MSTLGFTLSLGYILLVSEVQRCFLVSCLSFSWTGVKAQSVPCSIHYMRRPYTSISLVHPRPMWPIGLGNRTFSRHCWIEWLISIYILQSSVIKLVCWCSMSTTTSPCWRWVLGDDSTCISSPHSSVKRIPDRRQWKILPSICDAPFLVKAPLKTCFRSWERYNGWKWPVGRTIASALGTFQGFSDT